MLPLVGSPGPAAHCRILAVRSSRSHPRADPVLPHPRHQRQWAWPPIEVVDRDPAQADRCRIFTPAERARRSDCTDVSEHEATPHPPSSRQPNRHGDPISLRPNIIRHSDVITAGGEYRERGPRLPQWRCWGPGGVLCPTPQSTVCEGVARRGDTWPSKGVDGPMRGGYGRWGCRRRITSQ
jgi:hypothetical protein